MGNNQYYKNRALADLEGNWDKVAIATLIYMIICGAVGTVTDYTLFHGSSFLWNIICLPLMWGFQVYFLRLIHKEDISYERLFEGYKDFVRTFLTMFLYFIAVIIGTLLFIIPGIIVACGFAMAPFILKEDAEINAGDALTKSWQMMKGHKWAIFWLGLSFIGWAILACLTLGIGFLLLSPYMETACAHFYEDLKKEAVLA